MTNGNGRMDAVAKLVLSLIAALLSAILIWFGTTTHATGLKVSALGATVEAVKEDVGEIRRRIEFLERRDGISGP